MAATIAVLLPLAAVSGLAAARVHRPSQPPPLPPANATLRLLPAPLLACLAVLKGLDESGVLMLDGEEFYLTH